MYSVEKMKSDIVNNFEDFGPASLELTAGDEAPVTLAKKIFEYYVGGVRVEEADADNICQVSLTILLDLL